MSMSQIPVHPFSMPLKSSWKPTVTPSCDGLDAMRWLTGGVSKSAHTISSANTLATTFMLTCTGWPAYAFMARLLIRYGTLSVAGGLCGYEKRGVPLHTPILLLNT